MFLLRFNAVFLPPLSVRDVSSAGLVIANHQDIKSEIETRADSFTTCIEMGHSLINNNHYAADEVWATSPLRHILDTHIWI